MQIFLGVQDLKVPVWVFGSLVMINQLSWSSIHWGNTTWVDSGGYQIMKRGIKIDIKDVERKYKILNANAYMNLDIPSFPCQSVDERNFKHFEYFHEKEIDVIPIIHAYNAEDIDRAIDFYTQYTDTIAFGGIVPPTLKGGRKFVIYTYHYIRKAVRRVHVLGAGSPFMRKIFFNADSGDTASYRIRGAMGHVLIPGKGERYVGERKKSWRTKSVTKEELEMLFSFLEKTHYPYEININDWVNRSLINAWVMLYSDYEGESWEMKLSREMDKVNRDEIKDKITVLCKEIQKL